MGKPDTLCRWPHGVRSVVAGLVLYLLGQRLGQVQVRDRRVGTGLGPVDPGRGAGSVIRHVRQRRDAFAQGNKGLDAIELAVGHVDGQVGPAGPAVPEVAKDAAILASAHLFAVVEGARQRRRSAARGGSMASGEAYVTSSLSKSVL